ncbi:MAG: hypothetical protein HY927_10360 [Elusimicrobia bacterium]|nr:hypothetical protein [Elusimicrobiota bacterium]
MTRGIPSTLNLLAWVVVAAALGWRAHAWERPAAVVMGVSAREVEALCARTGYPARDCWDRLGVIGVAAALVPEERLSDLAADGRLLGFSKAEWEKWSAMGLLAPGATLKPSVVWIRDRAVLSRAAAAARSAGIAVSTSAAGGFFFMEFPDRFPWGGLSAGIAPEAARTLSRAGMTPVLGADAADGVPGDAVLSAWGRELGRVDLALDASGRRCRRAVFGGTGRLIVWRLPPEWGVEKCIAALRESLKELRKRGVEFSLPRPREEQGLGRGWLWKALLGLVALAGPLLAVRFALGTLKAVKTWARREMPLASPVLEIAAGLATCWGVAVLAGLGARVAAFHAGGAMAPGLKVWCLAAPLALGLLSLFPPPWSGVRRLGEAPITVAFLAKALALAALAFACLDAVDDPLASAVGRVLDVFPGEALWWLPWQWRGVLLGLPCLVRALELVGAGWGRPGGDGGPQPAGDPRPWLLLSLFGPASLIMGLSNVGLPLMEALRHSLLALALGSAIGAFPRLRRP